MSIQATPTYWLRNSRLASRKRRNSSDGVYSSSLSKSCPQVTWGMCTTIPLVPLLDQESTEQEVSEPTEQEVSEPVKDASSSKLLRRNLLSSSTISPSSSEENSSRFAKMLEVFLGDDGLTIGEDRTAICGILFLYASRRRFLSISSSQNLIWCPLIWQ